MTQRFISHRGGVGCEENFPGWDYTAEECEFLQAIDRYKRTRGRPYPTWREVLTVLRELGWRKSPAVHPEAPREGDVSCEPSPS
jgi:hypothetical protein